MANLARSKTREDDLILLVKDNQPDVAIITEAELGPDDTVVIPGYTPFYASASPSHKCRLFALVRNDHARKTKVLASSHVDIWLRLNISNPITIVGVYRQWSDTEQADLAAFYDTCATLLDNNRTIITGDFNLDFGRRLDKSYSRYSMASQHFYMMEALGLDYAGPHTHTYLSHGSFRTDNGEFSQRESILDHVYTLDCSGVDVTVLPYRATDHFPVKTMVSSCPLATSKQKWIPRRPLSKLTGSILCCALEEAFFNSPIDLYGCNDVEVVHDTIVSTIIKVLDKVAPYRMVPADKPGCPPLFLGPDTLQMIGLRDAAARDHVPEYRALRNKVCRLVRRDRLRSSLDYIGKSKNNPKKLWSLTRFFMGANTHMNLPSSLKLENGLECNDDAKLADTLNTYFINKILKIRGDISDPACGTDYSEETMLSSDNHEEFNFKYPSAGKVYAIIQSLKNTGATGVDDVPVSVLKLGATALSGPIAHLVRLSFGSGKVPSGFKTAIVRPVYKGKGKPTDAASSFRPVAILTAMSKILERCAFETLMDFLEPRLPAGQYGFRKARSTAAAIADAHGKWSSARAQGYLLGVMSFDLSSAFDTIDSGLLCTKLAKLGICGKPNKWFSDYLSNRNQCVQVGNFKSSLISVEYGVPQGSMLGPVLFLAMIADMPVKTGLVGNPSRGYVAYADDICVWSYGDSLQTVSADLTKIADSVSCFAAANYLCLNAEKTQVLWSGLPRHTCGPNINVNGVMVKPSSSIELLGVTFDKTLGLTQFLMSQHRMAAPILATVRRLARYLPPIHLTMVASALLVGKLGYAALATLVPRLQQDDPTSVLANKLQVCINDAARIVLGASRAKKMRIGALLEKSGLPSLNRLVVRGIAVECWRAINMGTPLGEVICGGNRASRPTRLGCSNKLAPPFKFPRDSMAYHAVRIWNMHEELRSATTLYGAKLVASRIANKCPL